MTTRTEEFKLEGARIAQHRWHKMNARWYALPRDRRAQAGNIERGMLDASEAEHDRVSELHPCDVCLQGAVDDYE